MNRIYQASALLLLFFMAGSSQAADRFPVLSQDEAWKRLAPLTKGKQVNLPTWARILARSLPRTTAGMLVLDQTHRRKNPVGIKLAAKMRWTIAEVNQCDSSRKRAEFDLKTAGVTEKDFKSPAEKAALTLARKLSVKGHSVTDEEIAFLVKHYGAAKVVAMAHLIAHGNFQDRILLAIGDHISQGESLAPISTPFNLRARVKINVPRRKKWERQEVEIPKDKLKKEYAAVQKKLDEQQKRKLRIPLPDWEKARKLFPPNQRKRPPSKIVWTTFSAGYQPILTMTWFNCYGQFRRESKLDRVYENSLFWVITHSNECFY